MRPFVEAARSLSHCLSALYARQRRRCKSKSARAAAPLLSDGWAFSNPHLASSASATHEHHRDRRQHRRPLSSPSRIQEESGALSAFERAKKENDCLALNEPRCAPPWREDRRFCEYLVTSNVTGNDECRPSRVIPPSPSYCKPGRYCSYSRTTGIPKNLAS